MKKLLKRILGAALIILIVLVIGLWLRSHFIQDLLLIPTGPYSRITVESAVGTLNL